MCEDFEGSMDTSSFDDTSTDITDTSSFSDPIDVGGIIDDIPEEPIESLDVEPIDSGLEAEISTAETADIDSLMDDAADTYTTEDIPSDVLDSSDFDLSDSPSDIDDHDMDAGSDIDYLMDEAAIESLDEVAMDTADVENVTENDIETLMNNVEPASDIAENLSEIEMDTSENSNDSDTQIESLLDAEETPTDESPELAEDLYSDFTEETQEGADVSSLMDESDTDDMAALVDESLEDTSDDFETEDVVAVETNMENEISAEEVSESPESLDSVSVYTDTNNDADITDIPGDEQGETEETFAETDKQPDSPLDTEPSAYDQLLNYYTSHNYGRLDYAEYSKDPEWQALNNAYLQELNRESVDYGGNETPDVADIQDELIVEEIPENSPELDAVLANEQDGIDAIAETSQDSSSLDDSIDGYANSTPIETIESIVDDDVSSEPTDLPQNDIEAFTEDLTDTNALQNTREDIQSGEIQLDTDNISEGTTAIEQDIPQELPEETPSATDLPNEINYDEVFEGLDNYDFDGIDYAYDVDRLDNSLDSFDSSAWAGLTLDEQKDAMNDLAEYVKDVIGFDNPPQIVYYNNPVNGDYGGYSPESNTLTVNEYMLYDNEEAADTVAHELWHAYQHQRASNPQSTKDYQYQYGFDNYIRAEDDFIAYQNQLVEAEARAFAQQFKDRLNMKGRRI